MVTRDLEEIVEKDIFPLVELINDTYDIKTVYSCEGHIYKHVPYVMIEIESGNVPLLKNALDGDIIEVKTANKYNSTGDFSDVTEEFYTPALKVVFNNNVHGENERVTIYACHGVVYTRGDLLWQRREFNENVIRLLDKYKESVLTSGVFDNK